MFIDIWISTAISVLLGSVYFFFLHHIQNLSVTEWSTCNLQRLCPLAWDPFHKLRPLDSTRLLLWAVFMLMTLCGAEQLWLLRQAPHRAGSRPAKNDIGRHPPSILRGWNLQCCSYIYRLYITYEFPSPHHHLPTQCPVLSHYCYWIGSKYI